MKKFSAILSVVFLFFIVTNYAFAQQPQLATFQETAQVIIDQKIANEIIASITLQSTSNQEIRIPSELESKILDEPQIVAVIFTNEENCILGVIEESCIMVNISSEGIEGGIFAYQDTGKLIGNTLIDDLNGVFDTDAKYHSTFVHYSDETNTSLETSGVVSGRGTISAVYTLPSQATDSLYEKISAILIPKIIRDSGGFYDAAKQLSLDDESKMTFSMITSENTILYQLKISLRYSDAAKSIDVVEPLKFLKSNQLKKSNYFSQGFYPLNSLVQIVVLSEEPIQAGKIKGNIVPTAIRDGERIPTDVTSKGWVFLSDSGEKIEAMYLFGDEFFINSNEFSFSIESSTEGESIPSVEERSDSQEFDMTQIIIIGGIIAAGVAAVVFYLKGFKSKN